MRNLQIKYANGINDVICSLTKIYVKRRTLNATCHISYVKCLMSIRSGVPSYVNNVKNMSIRKTQRERILNFDMLMESSWIFYKLNCCQ